MPNLNRALLATCAVISLGGLVSNRAFGQAYERDKPKNPAPLSTPDQIQEPPRESDVLPDTKKVVVSRLAGIAFWDNPEKMHKDGVTLRANGIWHDPSLDLLDTASFQSEIAKYLNKPLTLADINSIVSKVSDLYRTHGRPFVYVAIPPQFLGSGVVHFVIMEYRLDKVSVNGNHWFSSEQISRMSGLRSGKILTLSDVRYGIERLNDNPFRTVNAVFSPSTEKGETNVLLQTTDRFPLNLYGTFDTGGLPTLGREEWEVGGTWGNVFGLGHTLSYQLTHSVSELYNSHSINYSAPLPWGDQIHVFGSYAWNRPRETLNGTEFVENGHSGQASFRYVHDSHPIEVFGQKATLWQQISAGFDYKTTNNSIEFGGISVYATNAETVQFPVAYRLTLRDPFGETQLRNQATFSPGGLTDGNHRHSFSLLVPGASPRYIYDTMTLARTTWLPCDLSWTVQATGQISTTNLMYANQIGLGGLYTTRGYFTDTILGSEGVTVANEVHSPAWHLLRDQDLEQIGVFFDYGHVSQVRPIPNQVNSLDLSSVGLDLHLQESSYVNLSFNIGWRLRSLPTVKRNEGYGNKGAFGNISITVGY
ncbi:ShlB/FhaC/HecB family hemolysin secretion/activation protein [Gluconacetobacter sp. Hr-1-5]|uniref:ShlB/FhaC/HecB family hemolysin secretion/activation protein n=1 Tax=Gluconacetobacter sp. Hr-1-5 TaxID=3395370 RepID=UPI003B528B66